MESTSKGKENQANCDGRSEITSLGNFLDSETSSANICKEKDTEEPPEDFTSYIKTLLTDPPNDTGVTNNKEKTTDVSEDKEQSRNPQVLSENLLSAMYSSTRVVFRTRRFVCAFLLTCVWFFSEMQVTRIFFSHWLGLCEH